MIRRAFTLVELLIVVVVLGILASVALPAFTGVTHDAQINATITDLQKVRRHIGVFRARNSDQFPAVEEGLGTWGQIIGRDYLHGPPTNQYVGGENSRRITFGTGPDAAFPADSAYGWIYNPATGEVWAAGFDALDNPFERVPPEDPAP